MAVSSKLRPILSYLGSLLTNGYFYAGIALMAVLGIGGCFAINSMIMPSYTRHGDNITVPDVRNIDVNEARSLLERATLRVEIEKVRRLRPNIPVDVVVDQNPNPNTPVKKGRRVYLVVNSGTVQMVTIPDLISYAQREAENRIVALGLVAVFKRDPIPSTAPGTITRIAPDPGTSIKTGEPVTLYYSGGQSDKHVALPDVRGMTVEGAKAALLRINVRSINTDSQFPKADTVRRQGSAPGTRVREGFELRLYTRGGDDLSPLPPGQNEE